MAMLFDEYGCAQLAEDAMSCVHMSSMYLGLGERVAGAPCVEALPDAVLLSAIRPDHRLHLLQGGVAAVGTKQPPRFLQAQEHR